MSNTTFEITKETQRAANAYARRRGYGKATSVLFGAVTQPRIMSAAAWHFETKGGTRIEHPSAYAKSGWSNMVYIHAHCDVMMPHECGGEH